jgi:methionine-rich copper-binding protein CopC
MQAIIRAAVALVLSAPALAYAHAQLRRAEPAVGGTVRSPPAQVELTFSEALEPRFSAITVTDAAGTQVDKHDLHVVSGDAKRLTVSLGALPPGAYTVVWHATSVDTHRTEGVFTFTISP